MKLYRYIAIGMAAAAIASCWQAARAEGIQVYDNGRRIGAVNQNVINCVPPAKCGIANNAVRIGSDGGSGGGVTPTGLCGDGGTALGWDGGAYYCASITPAPTAWVTDLDCDFTAQTPQSLDAGTASDQPYPLCGVNFYSHKHNSLQSGNMPNLSANGIIITPAQSTSLGGNAAPCPGFYVVPYEIISGFDTSTRWRATMHWTANFTTSGDEVSFTEFGHMETTGAVDYFFGLRNGLHSTVGASPTFLYWATGSWGGDTVQYAPRSAGGGIGGYFDSSRNLGTIEAESGSGRGVRVSADWADGGAFPHVTASGGLTAPTVGFTMQNNGGQMPFLWDGARTVRILFCAQRNSNGHSGFTTQFKRFKLEHKP